MGGFFLCDDKGTNEVDINTFLSLVDAGEIVNPAVMASDIGGTNYIGKAIYFCQLVWFMIQILARLVYGLTVTLVELDTGCMALFTLALIYLWREKPLCPSRPHFFLYAKRTQFLYRRDVTAGRQPERVAGGY